MPEYPVQRRALGSTRDIKLKVAYRGDPADRREIELAFESIAREMLRAALQNTTASPKKAREGTGGTT